MSNTSDFFRGTIPLDLLHLMCGERLGSGVSREVFVFKPDPTFVLKFETGAGSFQNVLEEELWRNACNKTRKFLAPCISISANGAILLQKRTSLAVKFPKKFPAFFTDLKRSNFGMLGNKLVCHDYGYSRVYAVGLSLRLIKAEWWDE